MTRAIRTHATTLLLAAAPMLAIACAVIPEETSSSADAGSDTGSSGGSDGATDENTSASSSSSGGSDAGKDAAPDAGPANPCAAHGGTTYYVSPTGSDGYAGTKAAPFATVRYGATVLKAGDTLCVRAGTYTQEVAIRSSGAPGAPIVLSGYPGERPIIDPGPTGVGFWNAVYPCRWIEIRGFEIRNGTHGIGYDNAQFWTIEDNRIHDNGSLNTDGTHQGIAGGGADMVLARNVIYHNGAPPYKTNQNHGMYITGHRYLITNNIFYANEAFGLQIAAYGCSSHCRGDDFSGAVDWTVANNSFAFEMNAAGIVVWLPGASYGDKIGADLRNINIVNNVFYDNCNNCDASYDNGIVFDDERYGSNLAGVNWPSVLVENDLFYSSTGHPTFGHLGGGVLPVTMQNIFQGTDPLFVGPASHDFHVNAGSPCIDRGRTLASVPDDFDGKSRPQGAAYDIGPFER